MSIVLDGTSGITTPEIVSTGGPLVVNASAPDNSVVVDASGNVGIGTSSPTRPLDVFGVIPARFTANSDVASPTFGGVNVDRTAKAVNDGTGINFHLNNSSDALAEYAYIGALIETNTAGSQNGAILFAPTAAGTRIERMRITSAGALILAGSTAQKATGTTWSNPSDERLKDNIRDYGKGIAELMQVRVREWEYNGKGGTVEGTKGLGVVADEVMVVLPDTVENYEAKLNADDEEATAIKKFDATEITWLLVKAVQELKAINDAQAQTIESLTARVVALEQA